MPVLFQASAPELYQSVKDRNLELQYYLLETIVNVTAQYRSPDFTPDLVYSLHNAASLFIDDTPGRVRCDHVSISNSNHLPPDPSEIGQYLEEFFKYLNANFNTSSVEHLAAYALWRLTWIHPFNECNGRTARAFCYLVICTKAGYWLPGDETIHTKVRHTMSEYYTGLHEADESYLATKEINVSRLEQYITNLLFSQFSGTVTSKNSD